MLEEILTFGDAGDADRFVAVLKGGGVRARRRVVPVVMEEPIVRGPLAGLMAWIQVEIDAREGSEEPGEADPLPDLLASKDLMHLGMVQAGLIRRFERVARVLEGKQVGDFLYTTGLETRDHPGEKEPEPWTKLSADFETGLLSSTLIDAGVAEETGDGLRLLREVEAGAIESEIACHTIDPTPDLVEAQELALEYRISYDTAYRVEIEGAVHLAFTASELDEAVTGTSVDLEQLDDLLYNLQEGAQVIGACLEVLDREGRTTLEVIVKALRVVRIETDGTAEIVLDTTPEFVRALVDDLRKAGAVTGNERKLRRA